jgi:arsenate reductase
VPVVALQPAAEGPYVGVRRPLNVLFLSTWNSARTILAEALIAHWGGGKFRAFSAGSDPRYVVHPSALNLLQQKKLPTAGLHSKSWQVFARPGAPRLDFVFAVYDPADFSCPFWRGQPSDTCWEIANPTVVAGLDADKWAAFRAAFTALEKRIKIFTGLPPAALESLRLDSDGDEGLPPTVSHRFGLRSAHQLPR